MNLKKIGRVYHAHFTSAAGKPTSVTTRCTDLTEAKRVVKESGLADLETSAKAGRLTREAIGHITVGRKLTMTRALVEFEKYLVAISSSEKTVANNLTSLHAWVREANLETTPPSAVTETQIAKWINDKKSDSKYGTRLNNLSFARNFFKWAAGKGYCLGNPAALVRVNMDAMDHQQRERRVTEPMTEEDVKTVLEAMESEYDNASKEMNKIVHRHDKTSTGKAFDLQCTMNNAMFWNFATRCASETGLRLGDICNLEWTCFEKDKTLTLWTGKRDKRLELPISKALAELVTEIPVSHPRYLFPEQQATYGNLKRRSYLSLQYTRLLSRLGITGKSFHSIRHGLATSKYAKADKEELAKKLADSLTVGQIAQLLGHSDSKVTKGYIH